MPSAIQQIRELRALHEEGLLNAQEFARRKNTILDSVFALSKSEQQDSADAGGDNSSPTPDHSAPQIQRSTTDLGYLIGQHVQASGKEYRLEKLVGQGGMGQVWQVHDLSTEAELGYSEALALKIISPEWCASAAHRRLLIEEANLVRKLAHDNIVRVYDWGRDPATGSVFIVMEYLEGQDIESYLRQQLSKAGPGIQGLSLKHALKILRPVANALHYAWHKQGLVHRDLKPSNIFLCKNGSIKLLDFGIAANLGSARVAQDRLRSANLGPPIDLVTHAGSHGYQAPERYSRNIKLDQTRDVYSVAVVLYQLLTGKLPSINHQSTHEQLSCPQALDQQKWGILQRALSWNANERPHSVMELICQLDHSDAAIHPASKTIPSTDERDKLIFQSQQRKVLENERRAQAQANLRRLQEQIKNSHGVSFDSSTRPWEKTKLYLAKLSQERS